MPYSKGTVVLLLLLAGCGSSNDHQLSWDSNKEHNIAEYRVYAHRPHQDMLVTVTKHVPNEARQWVGIPDTPMCYFVEAVNSEEMVSEPSEIVCYKQ